MHPQRVERQHAGRLRQQAAPVGRDHRDAVDVRAVRRASSRRARRVLAASERYRGSIGSGCGSGSPAITSRQRRTRSPISEAFQSPHTPGPVASESASASACSSSSSTGSPPSASTTRGDGLRGPADHAASRCAAAAGGSRTTLDEHVDVRRPQTQPGADLGGQFGADDAVVTAAPLADVVQQRAEHQQVRSRHPRGESACPGDGFDEMPVDGPDVDDVARRQVADRAPLREQPAPQPGAVQRLDRSPPRSARRPASPAGP